MVFKTCCIHHITNVCMKVGLDAKTYVEHLTLDWQRVAEEVISGLFWKSDYCRFVNAPVSGEKGLRANLLD